MVPYRRKIFVLVLLVLIVGAFGLGAKYWQQSLDTAPIDALKSIYNAQRAFHDEHGQFMDNPADPMAQVAFDQVNKHFKLFLYEQEVPRDVRRNLKPEFVPRLSKDSYQILLGAVDGQNRDYEIWSLKDNGEIKRIWPPN